MICDVNPYKTQGVTRSRIIGLFKQQHLKFLMGLCLSKKSARESIMELEQQIKEKEKEIKNIKKNKERAGDFFIKGIVIISIGGISFLWVCKESFSFIFLVKVLFGFFLAGALTGLLYFGAIKTNNYRMNKAIRTLSRIKEKQKENIESLKKETKYEETHEIIRRYNKILNTEESTEERPEENIVDKIVRLI